MNSVKLKIQNGDNVIILAGKVDQFENLDNKAGTISCYELDLQIIYIMVDGYLSKNVMF